MEYYIYNIPVFILKDVDFSVSIPEFCQEAEEFLAPSLLKNIEAVYVGDFSDLKGRNALYSDGAIYMTCNEPTSFDMVENFVHEVAHSLEPTYGWDIYTDDLVSEFLGKRQKLYHLITAEGFHINPALYGVIEYTPEFDEFLANKVGYPTLLSLTMGLFVSPYGATSVQEYFANGFEKYFLDSPRTVEKISPVLYRKIEKVINADA